MNRVWLRPVPITVAALVAVLAVGVVTYAPQETGGCVAPPGAEQQDLDPDDIPEAAWPHTALTRPIGKAAGSALPRSSTSMTSGANVASPTVRIARTDGVTCATRAAAAITRASPITRGRAFS